MPELDNLFTAGSNKTTGVEATTDAKATLEDVLPSEESGLEQNQVEETPNVEVEPPVQTETAGESTQDEVDYKALYESTKLDKERIEKQHRDNQSYNDRRFNELQQEFSKFKEAKEQPKEKEYTQEELNDLQYSDPKEWFRLMAADLGYTQQPQQQAAPQANQLAIDEGVQRSLHEDYDDVVNNLLAVKAYHPEIIAKIQASPNKAKAAYEEGKKLQEASTNQVDAEALKEKLRAEILKEMEEGNNNTRTGLRKVPSSAPVKASATTKSKDTMSGLFRAGKGGRR